MNSFGKLIKDKRLMLGLTLREFCRISGYDVGYISRIENDILLPPEDDEKLEKLAKTFGILKHSKEWQDYYDKAFISRKQIPKDLDSRVVDYLPMFFRKASKKQIKKEDVDKLIDLIKGKSK